MINSNQPDVIIFMTDEERAIPPYETPEILDWRDKTLAGEIGSKKRGQFQPALHGFSSMRAESPNAIYRSVPRCARCHPN